MLSSLLLRQHSCWLQAPGVIYPDFPIDLSGFFTGNLWEGLNQMLIQFLLIKKQDFWKFVQNTTKLENDSCNAAFSFLMLFTST